MKKILHITFSLETGGTERVIEEIINGTSEVFSHQILCTDGNYGEIGQRLSTNKNITIHTIDRHKLGILKTIIEIEKKIRHNNIDIIHAHQYTPWIFTSLACMSNRIRVKKSRKFIFTEHGRLHPDRRRWKAAPINYVLSKLYDSNIAISKATKLALSRNEFISISGITVINNGIAKPVIDNNIVKTEKSKTLVLGIVSRIDKNKNHKTILKSLSLLKKSNIPFKFIVVGDGPEKESLQELSKELKITNSVYFTGNISNPGPQYDEIDIFILPSFTEGISMAILEAMARNSTIIASNVGGNPEIVSNGFNGYLIDPSSPNEIYRIVKNYNEERNLLDQHKKNNLEDFDKKWDSKIMCKKYREIYND